MMKKAAMPVGKKNTPGPKGSGNPGVSGKHSVVNQRSKGK